MVEHKVTTLDYIIEKIDQITSNTDYITTAIEEIKNIPPSAVPGDLTGSSKADAIATIVKNKEHTNQQLITLLTKMYDSIDKSTIQKAQLKALLNNADDPDTFQNVKEAIKLSE